MARAPRRGGGVVGTICVRMCDGFYWPLDARTPYRELQAADRACRAGCSSESRVFQLDRLGGDVRAARALDGLRYGAMPNALLYRRKLVAGCGCKPAPWSRAARLRHKAFAGDAADAGDDAGASGPNARPVQDDRPVAVAAAMMDMRAAGWRPLHEATPNSPSLAAGVARGSEKKRQPVPRRSKRTLANATSRAATATPRQLIWPGDRNVSN